MMLLINCDGVGVVQWVRKMTDSNKEYICCQSVGSETYFDPITRSGACFLRCYAFRLPTRPYTYKAKHSFKDS
ncbi:hypothetical protein Bca4012_053286 [Brassica carinata]